MENLCEKSSLQKVVVVTVTYNSSSLLARLLKFVDDQTYHVNKIIVVDNNSNDEHFTAVKNLQEKYLNVEVLRSDTNLGGAGGFELGVEYILSHYSEYDWIWLMDDDAFPEANCLENLLQYKDITDVGCLTPLIFGVELQKYQLYHHKIVSKYLNKDIPALDSIDDFVDILPIDTNAFVGPLFKMEIVKKIGCPDGRLFIYGDDSEYVYRTSRVAKVYLIKSAIINHRDTISNENEVNPNNFWKEYYKYRNRYLFIDKYKRNIISGIIGEMLVTRTVLKEIKGTLTRSKFRTYRKIKLTCEIKAMVHGIKGIYGKTIDPVDLRKRLKETNGKEK